jgi:hypothetical protein
MPNKGYRQTLAHRARRVMSEASILQERYAAAQARGEDLTDFDPRILQWADRARRLMADTDEHTEAARFADASRVRARRARNALQGEQVPESDVPDAFDPNQLTHEPMRTVHSHLVPLGDGKYQVVQHSHTGDNRHGPSTIQLAEL